MSGIVFLNGAYVPRAQAAVSIDDRGFLFGDGVYEVLRVVRGRYFEPYRHLRRLARSLAALALPDPAQAGVDVLAIGAELLRRNRLAEGDATLYIQVTRGAAPRKHAFPPPDTPPTILVAATPFVPRNDIARRGAEAITHPDLRWGRCDIKSINLLPNVLANQRAAELGAYEAILVRDGRVTEGTHTNVFAVVDGRLRTHPADTAILPGVTRSVVLELAAETEVAVEEDAIAVDELAAATEVFLTGTSTGVMPVVRIDGRVVGDGRPGPIARRLAAKLEERRAAPLR